MNALLLSEQGIMMHNITDWLMDLCPEIQNWQAEIISENISEWVSIERAKEREACAKLCEDSIDLQPYPTLTEMAAAIRARSNS